MRKQIFILALACVAVACGPSKKMQSKTNADLSGSANSKETGYERLDDDTYKLSGISTDETYGYTENNAIMVGNGSMKSGPASERAYLNALLGPNGEKITYVRRGSCCAKKSSNSPMGMAMLDIYSITYDGLNKPISLYINMYDPGVLKAPKGFTFRQ